MIPLRQADTTDILFSEADDWSLSRLSSNDEAHSIELLLNTSPNNLSAL
nr:hypothetical protein Q903MT_gene1967 [Picea sitchensis]